VRSADIAFEEKNEKGNWDVGYKVVLCLRIHNDKDSFIAEATYTEAAVGSASLPRRGDAHDMAIKTAESDALKRAAINLGTQFGLSLYNDGSMHDVVIETLVPPVSQLGTAE
jgi:recombination DNA repair RAD52 pathway protein